MLLIIRMRIVVYVCDLYMTVFSPGRVMKSNKFDDYWSGVAIVQFQRAQ